MATKTRAYLLLMSHLSGLHNDHSAKKCKQTNGGSQQKQEPQAAAPAAIAFLPIADVIFCIPYKLTCTYFLDNAHLTGACKNHLLNVSCGLVFVVVAFLDFHTIPHHGTSQCSKNSGWGQR